MQLATTFAVIGCAAAASIPACVRAVRLSRTAEATENVETIFAAGMHARIDPATPIVSTPLTPASVPRGTTVADPAGTWDHPTWQTLGIMYSDPHWYAYRVDVDPEPGTALRVVALGDLDGDGVFSTFERSATFDGPTVVARPGLVVTAELE